MSDSHEARIQTLERDVETLRKAVRGSIALFGAPMPKEFSMPFHSRQESGLKGTTGKRKEATWLSVRVN